MTYLTRAQSVPARDGDAARVSDLWDLVDDIFPGSRLTARRTPEDFIRFWDELTRRADVRKRAAIVWATRIEQLQQQARPTAVARRP